VSAPKAHLELRDRPLVDVLDLGVRFIAAHPAKYAWLTAIVIVPWFLVTWLVGAAYDWGLAWVIAISAGLFAQAPFTLLASRLVFEDKVPLGAVMADAMKAVPKLLLVRLGQLALVALGACVFGVLAFWAGAVLLFATEAALLERSSAGGALGRANRIVTGNGGEAVLALVFLLKLEIVFVLMGEYAGRSILEDLLQVNAPAKMFDVGGSPLALAGFWLFVPYLATARFLAYINMRTRAEGWDVQTRFYAIAARAKQDQGPVSERRAA
jgi:hypothetical protein